MLQKRSYARNRSFLTPLSVFVLGMLALAPAAPAQATTDPCDTALASPEGALALQGDDPVILEGVAEWETEILKLKVTRPGVLTLEAESGPEAEGSLQVRGASGLRLVDTAPLRSGRQLAVPVDPKEVYCLRVDRQAGTSGGVELRLDFVDLCQLRPHPDDHGDSFACATDLSIGTPASGAIAPGDRDVFAFALATAATVSMQSNGAAGTAGQLFDEAGTPVTTTSGSGTGSGFQLSASLPAGRYHLRVENANGSAGAYTVGVTTAP
jgi:hypothetical protein